MPQLSYHAHVIEVSQEALVTWSLGVTVGLLDIVGDLHFGLYFSMPGKYKKEYLRIIDEAIYALNENFTLINDKNILKAIEVVLPSLVSFASASREVCEWEEKNVSKKIKTTHSKATKLGGPQVPPWYNQEEFKIKLKNYTKEFSLYLDTLSKAIHLIQEIIPSNSERSWFEQLDRAAKRIPYFQRIAKVGYEEAFRN